jgi:membrane associated rhomboid family serine protease
VYFFLFFPIGTETRGARAPIGTILLLLFFLCFQTLATFRPDLFVQLVRSAYVPSSPSWSGALLGLFLHADWMHLAANAIYLAVFGWQIESRMGSAPLFVFFACGGMLATWVQGIVTPTTSWAFHAPVIGASGAVAALLGVSVVRFPHRRVRIAYFLFTIVGGLARASVIHLHAVLACAIWFGLQIVHGLAAWGNGGSSVAYAAHAGGFVAGMCAAFAAGLSRRVREEVHLDRGTRYFERGEWHAALGELTTHLRLVPDDFSAARMRAQALHFAGDSAESMREYRRLLREARRDHDLDRSAELHREMWGRGIYSDLSASALLRLAFDFQKSVHPEEAVGAYQEMQVRYPNHPGADLALLRAGEILWGKLGRIEDGRRMLGRLLASYPNSEWREVADARLASMRALAGTEVSLPRAPRGSGIWKSRFASRPATPSSPRRLPIPPED